MIGFKFTLDAGYTFTACVEKVDDGGWYGEVEEAAPAGKGGALLLQIHGGTANKIHAELSVALGRLPIGAGDRAEILDLFANELPGYYDTPAPPARPQPAIFTVAEAA